MSHLPLINNQPFFFKNDPYKNLEKPLTPLINGIRHLSAIVSEPDIFDTKVSTLCIRKLAHATFASLEIGGIAAAAYQISLGTNPALFLALSILTTLADVYLQKSCEFFSNLTEEEAQILEFFTNLTEEEAQDLGERPSLD